MVPIKNDKSTVKVEIKKLDDILDKKCPSIIKIDVEGYEFQVLNGAKDTLDNQEHAVIIELNGSGKECT